MLPVADFANQTRLLKRVTGSLFSLKGDNPMLNCTSCGSPIPDGQGKSCSMCYGDIAHGTDGYYNEWSARAQEREHEQREQESPECLGETK